LADSLPQAESRTMRPIAERGEIAARFIAAQCRVDVCLSIGRRAAAHWEPILDFSRTLRSISSRSSRWSLSDGPHTLPQHRRPHWRWNFT
jgi:hypothetical protein